MARLDTRDVKEILDMLEDGINVMPKLDKIGKMKMRSKIRKQVSTPTLPSPFPAMKAAGSPTRGRG